MRNKQVRRKQKRSGAPIFLEVVGSTNLAFSCDSFSFQPASCTLAGALAQMVREETIMNIEQPLLNKKELFAYIRACGLRMDDSLLQEFQEQGVMLPPRRGHGKVRPGLWTIQQRDLLRCLCSLQQQRGVYKISPRCNLPVWVWLYWGDEYGVTRDQVKKVMQTWAQHLPPFSLSTARHEAKRLVKEVTNHRESGVQRATREVAQLFYQGDFTSANLLDSLSYMFDPTQPPNGPHDAPILPENVSLAIDLRMEAINALVQGQMPSDIDWEWARCFHLSHLYQYILEQPGYAREVAGTPVEHLFSLETVEHLYSSACTDLASVLGLGLRYPSNPGIAEQLRLDVWRQRVKIATVTSKIRVSPIMLPNGTFPMSLEILETVTLHDQTHH